LAMLVNAQVGFMAGIISGGILLNNSGGGLVSVNR